MNDIIYEDLILSVNYDVCFGIVLASKTRELKEGYAKLYWKNLIDMF